MKAGSRSAERGPRLRLRLVHGDEVGEADFVECLRLLARWALQAHRRRTGEPSLDHARDTGAPCPPVAESVADNPLDAPAHSANMAITDVDVHDFSSDEAP